jgi:prolyl oligopeptidase
MIAASLFGAIMLHLGVPLLVLALCFYVLAAARAAESLEYPATRAEEIKETLHGVEVRDPFRWLENAKAPEVQEWMKAQDALARGELKKLPGRDGIAQRLRKLYYVDDLGVPQHHGSRYFFWRRHADKEKAIVYWREGKDGPQQVLFDPNTWSTDGSVALGSWSVTEDGKTVAYSIKKNNSDEATLYVMDVASGKKSEIDVIEGARYAHASWTPDGKSFYYTWLPMDATIPAADRSGYAEVRLHKLGEDPKKDTIIREKSGDPTSFVGAGISRDGHWLILSVSHGWTSRDVWFRDARVAGANWTPLAVGKPHLYDVTVWDDQFYIRTNEDAPRYRMFKADPKDAAREKWREIVPERRDATLEAANVVGGRLSLTYVVNATSELQVRDLQGKLIRTVALPGVGTAGGLYGREDEDEAYFIYVSFTTPREIHSTSVASGESKLWSKLELDVDPSPYTVDQVWFPSKDGTKISMFVVRRKDMKYDGSNPTLLTGYGGFQLAMTPGFNSGLYPWLERGGVFAMPNLRGGSEYGEEWHRNGMLDKKQNVFDDFAAAAQWLIDQKVTSASKLAISGGSNGGLLVGAAMVQHPELFKTVVCEVPLLDMVRYHLFGTGKTWIAEYGSADDAKLFPAIFAYSPYHHVQAGAKYPSLLMLSADSDDRVDPMHARKFVAAMQSASKSTVLLRIEMNAGHGGSDMLKAAVEKGADRWSFIMSELGVKP